MAFSIKKKKCSKREKLLNPKRISSRDDKLSASLNYIKNGKQLIKIQKIQIFKHTYSWHQTLYVNVKNNLTENFWHQRIAEKVDIAIYYTFYVLKFNIGFINR